MATTRAKLFLFAVLTASLTAPGAFAKPRAVRPAPKAEVPAPAPVRQAFVQTPRRAEAPALALRPEFSEGEWSEPGRPDRLDPAALEEAAAPVITEYGRATTARAGSNLAKIGERQLQGAQVPTSRLDQPIASGPPVSLTTGGLDLGGINLRPRD